MPAQTQDQTLSNNQTATGTTSNGSNFVASPTSSNGTSTLPDPYATLRAEKVTSDLGTMTASKRLEMEQDGSNNKSLVDSAGVQDQSGLAQPANPTQISTTPLVNDTGAVGVPADPTSIGTNSSLAIDSNDDLANNFANDGSTTSPAILDLVGDKTKEISDAKKIPDEVGIADLKTIDTPTSEPTSVISTLQQDKLVEQAKAVDQNDDPVNDFKITETLAEKDINKDNNDSKTLTGDDDQNKDPIAASSNDTTALNQQSDDPKNNIKKSSTLSLSGSATLADVLFEMGVIDKKKADEVKLSEVKSGNSQEDILKGQNFADEIQIAKAKAKLYNVEFIDLSKVPVMPEALNLLPQQVAERFNVYPISVDESSRKVILAMADPLDLTAVEFVEQRSGMSVEVKAADPTEIQNMITAGYTTSLAKEVSEALKDVSSERSKVRTLDAGRTGLIREEKVAEVVTHILGFAIKSRASDVHIEPQERSTRVRYRIDGILQEKLTIPRELHDALVSRIKILSGMKIDEKRVPQDGRFNFRSEVEEVDLRVSTLPTTWGEKIVMRLLKKSGGIPDLPELGLRGRALKNLQEAIIRPHGIVLITGPTGSGKTTTLYSIIQKINTSKVNIMTLEDPVEYKMHGVNQVQVNPTAGLTFASGMRSFLRQDPNVILVGEIRDQETADLAIQASLTGHLVFSTLHTNSAAGALPRLLDMGAEPYLLASSITAIVGQRVARKIHDDCKTSYKPDPKIIDQIKEELGKLWQPKPGEISFYKGAGCQACGTSGYLGRVGVFEVLPVSEKIGRQILEQAPSSDIDKQAREEGMITMKQDGFLKVVEGVTTIEEVLRVAQE